MTINKTYNADGHVFARFFNQAQFGLAKKLGDERPAANILEKAGNGVLYITGQVPRCVKKIVKSLQDPRVVTLLLTAVALTAVSFAFYPTASLLATKAAYTFVAKLVVQIPVWAVRLSAYILTCSTIVGYSLRAQGRFCNTELMKQYYGLPVDFPKNPAYMTHSEIKAARTVQNEQV